MLKRIREKKGITQAQLAAAAGTTQEYIAMIESGARKNPSIELLQRLARVLKVKVADLLE